MKKVISLTVESSCFKQRSFFMVIDKFLTNWNRNIFEVSIYFLYHFSLNSGLLISHYSGFRVQSQ